MDNLLSMKNITKRFGGVTALENVDIDLEPNEIHCLVGENGAGKSTLMKILSGSYPHGTYDGSIHINGQEAILRNTKDSETHGVEMIYQEISMHLDLSVAENIFLGHLPKIGSFRVDWAMTFAEAQKVIDVFGLNVSPKDRVRNLSTSQQQLVAIARAIVKKPKILVLDEPTSAITEKESEKLFEILMMLKEQGISCIYISHKLKEVFRLADRITVLRDGTVINTYRKELIDSERVIQDMVGRKIENMFPKKKVKIGDVVLDVRGISVPHPEVREKFLVEDVSFSVRAGEILGIGGLVGAGRSELVGALFGDVKSDGNHRVTIDGNERQIQKPAQAIEAGIGLLTEDRKRSGFVPTLDIKHNMVLANLKKISKHGLVQKKVEKDLVDIYFNKMNIKAPSIDSNILQLSGGNQQKVVLAKWLMNDLKVIILDEPTRGIDVGAKVEIYQIMTELASQGIGIVMISSELPELLAMCDRIVVLSNGRVSAQLDRSEFSEERYMAAATGFIDE